MAGSESPRRPPAWIGDHAVFHGEGAFWDGTANRLRYVDMLAGDIMSASPTGAVRDHVGDVVALVRDRRGGGYVAAVERGFVLLDDRLRVERTIAVFDDPGVRMNEGACDASGRLFCGSMAYDARQGAGRMYRLDPDLSVHVVMDSVTIPNGLVWTDGGAKALHADTGERAVHSYEYDAERGVFGARDVFIDFGDGAAAPDGMALDREGGLWVAMWGGGAVRRYDSRGRLVAVIDLPVTNVTSCAFGGEHGMTLFVTTSRQGIDAGSEPQAGLVYAIDVDVEGAPVHPFAG
ncbi:SMP-30/gluconolactonase/LRE family protein [Planococcus sp. APC 4015]|nr:SMP-30/gluconolactonase/LRE family protein [Planococcus sp. APC 4015]